MAGQGGPHEETWRKMTAGQKRGYRISITVILCVMLALVVIRTVAREI